MGSGINRETGGSSVVLRARIEAKSRSSNLEESLVKKRHDCRSTRGSLG